MDRKKISKRDFLKAGISGVALLGVGDLRSANSNISGMESLLSSPPQKGPGRFSKAAPYSIVTPKGVKCQICPNNCILKDGGEGICRTHLVHKGVLYTNAYGNPCSVHVDPIEKKPLFHYLPSSASYSIATAGCNLACLNCQNWEISQQSPTMTRNMDMFPDKVVSEALLHKCSSIAYTYSEPVAFYEYTFDTAKIARSKGVKNLLISNGFINDRPLRDLAQYIDAANINLKSFSDEIYGRLNGGSLQPVLNTLKVLKEMGVWLEITNLVVPGWTDDLEMIREMCGWLNKNGFADTPLHFSRFFPLHKLTTLPYTPELTLQRAREIALKSGLHYVYIGNVPGTVAESTYCPKCKKVVVERKGFTVLRKEIEGGKCRYCATPVAGHWG